MQTIKAAIVPVVFCFLAILLNACSKETVETVENFEVIVLPDGSTAYLNYNSFIQYDTKFHPRQIQLGGEVFFDVLPGDDPFVISVGEDKIVVLGTELNVKSDQETLTVEVEEGHVELRTQNGISELKRGERAFYKKSENLIQKGVADFQSRKWRRALKIEFNKMGKEVKEIGKDFKRLGKDIKKEFD